MENPAQLIFTTEQLFSLAPVVPDFKEPQIQFKAKGDHLAAAPIVQTTGENLWSKYKWPIVIFSTVVIGGVCYYFYHKRQKNKEVNQTN